MRPGSVYPVRRRADERLATDLAPQRPTALSTSAAEREHRGDLMKRISSRMTFLGKRVFPTLWFGFFGFMFISTVAAAVSRGKVPLQFWILPVVMAGFGYLLMSNLVFDLADEVWDAGSELVVKNGEREERVALSEIVNVSYSVVTNPQRVTLTLRRSTPFGKEITFAAPTTWIPFARSPLIDDLIDRVDVARSSRR